MPKPRLLCISSAIALIAACLCLFSCSRPAKSDSQEQLADSLIRENLGELHTNPHRTDSLLAAVQARFSGDSAAWLRVGLFRGIARNFAGEEGCAQAAERRAISWCRKNAGHNTLEGIAWNHLGNTFIMAGQRDSATACFETAMRVLERADDKAELVTVAINLADAYLQTDRPVAAAGIYRRANFLADSLRLTKDLVPINAGLASVYVQIGNYAEAHRCFDRVRKLVKDDNIYGQFFFHTTEGNCWFYEKRYDKALACFRRAERLAQMQSSPLYQVQTQGNIGETLLHWGRRAEAAPHIHAALRLLAANPAADRALSFYIYSLAAELQLAQGNIAAARRYLELARRDKPQNTMPRYLANHYGRLRRYFEKEGDWREAYRYQMKEAACLDSMRSLQASNIIAEAESRFARDTTLLHQRVMLSDYAVKTSRQRSVISVAVAAIAVLLLAAAIAVVVVKRRNEREYRRQVETVTKLRMGIVRNRMSPHYVFNVLGTVLPKFNAYPELTKPLELLVDVLRGNLISSGQASVTLAEELALVERYVELYHYSHGPYPEVTWTVGEGVDTQVRVPSMCLQIPVENALKHAFVSPTADCRISVRVAGDEKGLTLTVTDNGAGYNPGRVRADGRDTGTGLRTLFRTIELLNTRQTPQAAFTVRRLPKPQSGTETVMTLPAGYVVEL